MGKILLFYKYVDIEYPGQIIKWQKQLCTSLDLKGRVFIGKEGINATLGGSIENTEKYKTAMESHDLFKNIDWKESPGGSEYFPKLRIIEKQEIVHLGLDINKYNTNSGGKHLTPEETHELLNKNPDDLIVLDARNNYEWRIGTFKNAITPDIENFRELPEYIDKNQEQFQNKKVLMFCTGGIRCERASSYLKSKNIAQEVYQIQGGIHRYIEKYPEGHFRGKNYVFDGRIAVKANDDILATCDNCDIKYDEYTNCVNVKCNKKAIMCPECINKYKVTCGPTCYELVINKKVKVRTKPCKFTKSNILC